ncbi:hypothetical protein BDV93DRAFT_609064 [Ceratobasidium sp. AG-I]|nr:hypothetical protein BDV93DRAFT_609064 [Ceratobasidium sp. AG-I]
MSVRKGSNTNGNTSLDSVLQAESHSHPRWGIGYVHRAQQRAQSLDMCSERAFSSLTLLAPSTKTSAPRIHQGAPSTAHVLSSSLVIENIDLSTVGKNGTLGTISEVIRRIMLQTKNVELEASTQYKYDCTKTSLVIKAESEYNLEDAKRKLSAALNPIITRVIQAPVSARGAIIGRKGANLAQLRAKYDVRIDIPRQGVHLSISTGNPSTCHLGLPSPGSEQEEELTQPVSVTGTLGSVTAAIAEINMTIAAKCPELTRRVRIPDNIYPFIADLRSVYEALAQAERPCVTLALSPLSHELVASGDRLGVLKVVDTVSANVEKLGESLESITLPLDKPQHHLLVGSFAGELMESTKCVLVLPTDPNVNEVTIWGQLDSLPQGIQTVMKQAYSMHTESVSVPAPSSPIYDYLLRTDYFGKVMAPAHPGVQAYIMPRGEGHAVDLIGEKPVVAAAIEDVKKVFKVFLDLQDSTPPAALLNDAPMATYPRDPKYYDDNGNIVFLVGGVLFKLLKSILLARIDQAPHGPARTARSDIERSSNGTNNINPLVISELTAEQFRWFLLLLLGTEADAEYRSFFASSESIHSPTKDIFLCYLGIYIITRHFGMSKLHTWSHTRLEMILRSVTGFVNTTWDKCTIMQAAACAYEGASYLSYDLRAFLYLALSTSAPNNPLAHRLPLSSNLDTCVALYKDRDLPERYPSLFGYVFTLILSLGHHSPIWTSQLTREDRNILYTAQAHLISLGVDPNFELSRLLQPASQTWSFRCTSCTSHIDTAWSTSFAGFGSLNSTIPLEDISKLVLLPSYR